MSREHVSHAEIARFAQDRVNLPKGVHSNFTLGAILAKVRLSPSVKDAQS